MTLPKIKPCPECGKPCFAFAYEAWNGGISSWCVECDTCFHRGSCEGTKLQAIRVHNQRAIEAVTATTPTS